MARVDKYLKKKITRRRVMQATGGAAVGAGAVAVIGGVPVLAGTVTARDDFRDLASVDRHHKSLSRLTNRWFDRRGGQVLSAREGTRPMTAALVRSLPCPTDAEATAPILYWVVDTGRSAADTGDDVADDGVYTATVNDTMILGAYQYNLSVDCSGGCGAAMPRTTITSLRPACTPSSSRPEC